MLATVTPAATEPVTLDEAKAHLRVVHSFDDQLISSLITSAREVVELNTGRALAEAGYLWASDSGRFPVELPLWPIETLSAVTYADDAGVRHPITDYVFDVNRSVLAFTAGTDRRSLNVEFTTSPAVVPEALKSAIKLRVQAEYESEVDQVAKIIEAAERIEFRFRVNLGV